MKTLFSAVVLSAVLGLSAAPAIAADYTATAHRTSTGWNLRWTGDSMLCNSSELIQKEFSFLIDGVELTTRAVGVARGPNLFRLDFLNVPDGNLTSATYDGKDYITCGEHKFYMTSLMPPPPPPAPIPTLSEWAMIALGAALAGGAALTIHRRRMA